MELGHDEMQRPSFLGRGSTRKSECSAEDSRRRSRNLGEKRRRDQFNALVRQLAALVGPGPRKMDKSSVLRATIAFLRHARSESALEGRAGLGSAPCKPGFVSGRQLVSLVLDAADAALLVVCPRGRVLFSSDTAACLLAPATQTELQGSSLFDLVHETDHTPLLQMLSRQGQGGAVRARLRGCAEGGVELRAQPTPRGGGAMRLVARPMRALRALRAPALAKSSGGPFSSRHSLAGHFLQVDARAARLLGFHQRELLGTSRFDLAHPDDLEALARCHRDVMLKGEASAGPLRFLSKGGRWVWLTTSLYVTYHQWNAKPEFLVCSHRLPGSELPSPDTRGSVSDSSDSHSQVGSQRSRVTLTQAQARAQAQLVRRHARLQRLITAQQEELRQVARQLARANQRQEASSPATEN